MPPLLAPWSSALGSPSCGFARVAVAIDAGRAACFCMYIFVLERSLRRVSIPIIASNCSGRPRAEFVSGIHSYNCIRLLWTALPLLFLAHPQPLHPPGIVVVDDGVLFLGTDLWIYHLDSRGLGHHDGQMLRGRRSGRILVCCCGLRRLRCTAFVLR